MEIPAHAHVMMMVRGVLGLDSNAVLLGFLGLKVVYLIPHREKEFAGKFLPMPVDISLANFNLDLSVDVVTILFSFSMQITLSDP